MSPNRAYRKPVGNAFKAVGEEDKEDCHADSAIGVDDVDDWEDDDDARSSLVPEPIFRRIDYAKTNRVLGDLF